MTDPKDTVPDTFPDVRVQPRTALIILAGLAGIYAAAFVMLSPPAKQDGLSLYASFGLGASLLVLSYIDMRTGLLLDIITLPLIAAGIAFGWLAGGVWLLSIGGAVLGYVLIAGLGLVWRRGPEATGVRGTQPARRGLSRSRTLHADAPPRTPCPATSRQSGPTANRWRNRRRIFCPARRCP